MPEQILLGKVQCDFLSLTEFKILLADWLESKPFHHIVTLNPEMVMSAETNPTFQQAIQSADLKVPDGAGLIWARWYLRSLYWPLLPSLALFMFQSADRITGIEAISHLAQLCSEKNKKIYLLGGTKNQVEKTATVLRHKFPTLVIKTAPDHVFSLDGPVDIINHINSFQPDVLLVAYGSPKQTIWIEQVRHQLSSVKIAMGVGGAFAILSEERTRAPRTLRKLNLEWLWRLLLEPSRLPRIWQAAVNFPLLIQKQKDQTKQNSSLTF